MSKFISGFFSDKKPENSETVSDRNNVIKGNWDRETKISSMDNNANEIKMSIGHQKSNVSKVSDDPVVSTTESGKANAKMNNKETDDKERIEPADKGKTRQFEISEKLDESEGCGFKKPTAKTSNAHKIRIISMANLILLSVMFGIAGARKLENLDSNELVKETPSWVTPKVEDKNYEDELISAYDCLDGTLPNT